MRVGWGHPTLIKPNPLRQPPSNLSRRSTIPPHVCSRSNTAIPTKSHTLSTEGRKEIDESKYAFPDQRKEPLENASHVRNAIARFDQVKGVSDEEREKAFHRIKDAAKNFGVKMEETNWKQLGKHPHTANSSH